MEQFELLVAALKRGELLFSPRTVGRFSQYYDLLLDWNKRINLISRKDESRVATRHFIESFGLVKVVQFSLGSRVMDLGSGAGFPGIPIKIVRPDLNFVLVESKRKKVLFLKRVIEALGLEKIEVRLGRAEELGSVIAPVDFVVSRSVADLCTLLKWSWEYFTPRGGKLVVVKGPDVDIELTRLQKKSSELNVKRCEFLKYDPFPDIYPIRECCVAVVEIAQVN